MPFCRPQTEMLLGVSNVLSSYLSVSGDFFGHTWWHSGATTGSRNYSLKVQETLQDAREQTQVSSVQGINALSAMVPAPSWELLTFSGWFCWCTCWVQILLLLHPPPQCQPWSKRHMKMCFTSPLGIPILSVLTTPHPRAHVTSFLSIHLNSNSSPSIPLSGDSCSFNSSASISWKFLRKLYPSSQLWAPLDPSGDPSQYPPLRLQHHLLWTLATRNSFVLNLFEQWVHHACLDVGGFWNH